MLPTHVFLTTLALGFSVALDIVLALIARRGDAAAFASAAGAFRWAPIAASVFLIGTLVGVGETARLGFSFVSPWLLTAYGVFAIVAVAGFGGMMRRYRPLFALAKNGNSAEFTRRAARTWPISALVSTLGMAALVAIMYLRPRF